MGRWLLGATIGLLVASCLRQEPLDAAPEAVGTVTEPELAATPEASAAAPRTTVRITEDPAAPAVHAALARAESALVRGDYVAMEAALDEVIALDPDNPAAAELRWEAGVQRARREEMLRPRATPVSY